MSFGSTFGAMLFAFFIDSVLYGVATLMILQYFAGPFQDGWKIRTLVVLLGVFTTLQVVAFCGMVYQPLISDLGDYPVLVFVPPAAFVQVYAIYPVASLAQLFFASKIWSLSQKNLWLTAPIVILSIAQFVAGIVDTSLGAVVPRYDHFHLYNNARIFQSSAAALCDIAITFTLWCLLRGNRTGVRSTDNVVNTLIIQSISRGAITSLAAILYMVLFLAKPDDFWFMIAFLPVSQHYVISVMTALNSRTALRESLDRARQRSHGISFPLSSISKKNDTAGVHITTTSVVSYNGEIEKGKKDERLPAESVSVAVAI